MARYRALAGSQRLIVGPRHGYRRLHEYYQELAAEASGEWLMIWNDDCVMQTPDWLTEVARFDGRLAVLNAIQPRQPATS